jgi:hypothetical protein
MVFAIIGFILSAVAAVFILLLTVDLAVLAIRYWWAVGLVLFVGFKAAGA